MESKDLFTEILDEKDYSIMKDLFGKISMETDSEQAIKEVERYLDYRNYMNYDIKITNKYGDESYFSKINREKVVEKHKPLLYCYCILLWWINEQRF